MDSRTVPGSKPQQPSKQQQLQQLQPTAQSQQPVGADVTLNAQKHAGTHNPTRRNAGCD